jgi:hypothetical protein
MLLTSAQESRQTPHAGAGTTERSPLKKQGHTTGQQFSAAAAPYECGRPSPTQALSQPISEERNRKDALSERKWSGGGGAICG